MIDILQKRKTFFFSFSRSLVRWSAILETDYIILFTLFIVYIVNGCDPASAAATAAGHQFSDFIVAFD